MQSVLDGFNGTIFAYGQTGTGKTFTMQGILATISDLFLPPSNEVCEGYVFTGVCHSVHRGGGVRGCSGGMRGCSRGHAWLLLGGHAWQGGVHCERGCAWLLPGGMYGCSWGHAWLLPGGCVVAPRAVCVVASRGGVCGKGGACMAKGGMCGEGGGVRGMHSRSLRGRYASYWNTFLLVLCTQEVGFVYTCCQRLLFSCHLKMSKNDIASRWDLRKSIFLFTLRPCLHVTFYSPFLSAAPFDLFDIF